MHANADIEPASIEEAALRYMAQGYAVIPSLSVSMFLNPARIPPLLESRFLPDRVAYRMLKKVSKAPTRPLRLFRPFASPEEASRWLRAHPRANIQLATGRLSGIAVLDIDHDRPAYRRLAGIDLPPTRRVLTGEGEHYYCLYPPGAFTRRNLHGNYLLGEEGSVVAPPSMHANGKRYRWQEEGMPLIPLPAPLLEAPPAMLSQRPVVYAYRIVKHLSFHAVGLPMLRGYFHLRRNKLPPRG